LVGVDPKQSALLVLGDPYTFPADVFLEQLNEEYAGLPVTGGMASGVRGPGECRLIRGGEVMPGGAVGVLLQGLPGLRTVVSQGCRPVGRAMVITRGQDNIITELGGKPPLARLQEMWQELDAADRNLVQQGLHLGLVINEYQGAFRRGDFLVRNVVGIDRDTGALAVTDRVRVGQTVQFHVRDAASADDDLRALLRADGQEHAGRPGGALLFTCNGRGTRMFPTPNHDVQALHQEIGAVPVAGFFAQGELGPVTGQNFMHGFTASVVLFGE
jgi:small ligand-binding sensory domain FIST